MENVMTVAAYVYNRYQQQFDDRIDEMKLHKLMYFAQREALIQTGEPLFDAQFRGWKYGPVLKEIRTAYHDDAFALTVPEEIVRRITPVMDRVFADYAHRDSWSLSRLTHGEISWRSARKGIAPDAVGDKALELSDIRRDAARVAERREMLDRYGLL